VVHTLGFVVSRDLAHLADVELWRRALSCFAVRDWWMTHELLEELWRRHPDTHDARVCQGLLQAAVCLYHYGNGNLAGARPLARQALQMLQDVETTPPQWAPVVPLQPFIERFRTVTAPLVDGTPSPLKPLDPSEIPDLDKSPASNGGASG
jgi:hypothetical protein